MRTLHDRTGTGSGGLLPTLPAPAVPHGRLVANASGRFLHPAGGGLEPEDAAAEDAIGEPLENYLLAIGRAVLS